LISIEINSNFADIKDIDIPIREITEVVKNDIQSILDGQKALTSPYEGVYTTPKPLNKEYRAWKLKKLGYTDIYKGKNLQLIKSLRSKSTKVEGNIYINLEYAKYVDKDRNFFGISREALERTEKLLLKTKIG
jgi:hypothetical protein